MFVCYVVVKFVVGVGDSFVGVMVWFLNEGNLIEEVFCLGVVVGVVIVLIFGIEFCCWVEVFVFYDVECVERFG